MDIEYIKAIDPSSVLRAVEKGSILQFGDSPDAKVFYVKKGLLRSYIIDGKGKEHTFMFAPEGWLIGDIESQEFEQPLRLYIDCLEDSEVLICNNYSFRMGHVDAKNASQNVRLLYRRVGMLQRRVLMLMSAPAVDRYRYFLEMYPELVNRVPQRLIASYLGVTPQALSGIRKKMTLRGR